MRAYLRRAAIAALALAVMPPASPLLAFAGVWDRSRFAGVRSGRRRG